VEEAVVRVQDAAVAVEADVEEEPVRGSKRNPGNRRRQSKEPLEPLEQRAKNKQAHKQAHNQPQGSLGAAEAHSAAVADLAFLPVNTASKSRLAAKTLQPSCVFRKIHAYRCPKPIARNGAMR
jgi:hypothetical protein